MADGLHPDAKEFLDRTEDSPGIRELPIRHARDVQRRNALGTGDPEPVDSVEDVVVRGDGHGIPVRVYRPAGAGPFPVLVWAHGGGFVLGDIDTEDPACRALANAAGCIVASVDYRLAPEHEFPAALRDVRSVVDWAAESAPSIVGDPERIAVGGQSAGANLAAATALWSRDSDGPRIAYQVLVVPVVAYTPTDEADDGQEWTSQDAYLSDPLVGRNPYAYPLEATSFADLPPATIVTAGHDPLQADGEAYRDALDEDGVTVSHHHYGDMIHVFFGQLREPEWERAREAVGAVADDLRERLH